MSWEKIDRALVIAKDNEIFVKRQISFDGPNLTRPRGMGTDVKASLRISDQEPSKLTSPQPRRIIELTEVLVWMRKAV